MNRQIRQPDRQYGLFDGVTEAGYPDCGQRRTDERTYWKERSSHESNAQRPS